MSELSVIKAKPRTIKIDDDNTYRVCAYCRVSTDQEDQINSMQAQIEFFEDYFEDYPNWIKVDIFADEGMSGTSLNKRDAFHRMCAMAKSGKIDLILTKEVSRFSRNIQDFLNIINELSAHKVYVYFLSDDLYTERQEDIPALTDLIYKAQSESEKTSRRVQWGQERRMRKGVVFGRREMYAYRIVKDEFGKQHFVVVEEEAEIVRDVFNWFAAGDGTHTIARRLEQQGRKTQRYKNGWTNMVILRMLRNEKYVGDLLQGKTFTQDPLSHKKLYNRGEKDMYYIKDHHPDEAIIDRALWDKVQRILEEKAPSAEMKAQYAHRYWTSGKIYCGSCGGRYISYQKKQKNTPYKAWVCFENHARGRYKQITLDTGEIAYVGCNARRVNDKVLKNALYDLMTEVMKPHKESIVKSIQADLIRAYKPKDTQKEIAKLQKDILELDDKIQNWFEQRVEAESQDDKERFKRMIDKHTARLSDMRKQLAELQSKDDFMDDTTAYINACIGELEKVVALDDEEINEGLYERITKKIVVYPCNVLELSLSFLNSPIRMRYQTSGKGDLFKTTFSILDQKEFEELRQMKEALGVKVP